MPNLPDRSDERVDLPPWLPQTVRHYLRHTEQGISIRGLARDEGVHASTVLRQIRRLEQRRDDLLVDEALTRLGQVHFACPNQPDATLKENAPMIMQTAPAETPVTSEANVMREARRILRRLCESGAVLAVSPDLDKAAVLRSLPDGRTTRTAVVAREVAQVFALKDWISGTSGGKVLRYKITSAGQGALKRMLAEDLKDRKGMAEAAAPFGEQHRDWDEREVCDDEDGKVRRIRYNRAESPVGLLSRRKDGDGQPFLTSDLVAAAERLREDFELSQMGPRVAQNWESFLTAGTRGGFGSGVGSGPQASKDRVAAALRDLGPGLGDMALRCCCFLEGLEAAEKRMGWSARSGKIVLRIALQRLAKHYEDTYGKHGPLIG